MSRTQPPDELGEVIAFVNTLEPEERTDAIGTPESLRAWLRERELLPSAEPPISADDHARAIALREALRDLMSANNGGPVDELAVAELEDAARRGGLAVHFGAPGTMRMEPDAGGFAGALGALLVPVAQAMQDATWERVKACREPDCREAFYDRSRNRSGVWCRMALCGNRTKVRSYRVRARGAR